MGARFRPSDDRLDPVEWEWVGHASRPGIILPSTDDVSVEESIQRWKQNPPVLTTSPSVVIEVCTEGMDDEVVELVYGGLPIRLRRVSAKGEN